LQPGSPAWVDYCKRKYVSFNEAKGIYLSKTGIERKCLVTADFK
jgi:BA14K-like protein